MRDRYEITINMRAVVPPHHSDPSRGVPRWIVEAWDTDYDIPTPVAIAYVAEVNKHGWVILEYVVVLNSSYLRQGAATALIEWCKERWPGIDGLEPGDACSDEGRALAEKFERNEVV